MNAEIKIPPCTNEKVPAPAVKFRHSHPLQTRFNDFDVFGHMNNTAYFSLLDLGKVNYYKAVLGDRFDFLQIAVVIVNINISFFSPAYFNEPLVVLTACEKLSVHSLVLEQRVVNPETGDVKCVARSVMAGFDIKNATGIEIPAEWARAIADFENWD